MIGLDKIPLFAISNQRRCFILLVACSLRPLSAFGNDSLKGGRRGYGSLILCPTKESQVCYSETELKKNKGRPTSCWIRTKTYFGNLLDLAAEGEGGRL